MSTTQSSSIQALTKYPIGSFREISRLSLPLMLSALSGALMMFFDRYILAHYSLTAMNAAVSAGMSVWVFQILVLGIAGISEVFVGQYNGAKQYDKVAIPVWQMIWFSLASCLIMLPIAVLFPESFVPERFHAEGAPYFAVVLSFSFLVGISAALSAFFVGQGKVTLITIVVIVGNLLNILGDIIFIFGFKTLIPSMGATGAAIATVLSQIFQCVILFAFFLNTSNRTKFKTNRLSFDLSCFWDCFKIGFPSALGHMIEIAAWSIQLHLLSSVSIYHVTVASIGQTLFGLVAFTTEGLNKGIIAIASNLIGAKVFTSIKKVFKSSFILHLIISVLIIVPLLLHPEWFLDDFIKGENDPYTIQLVITYAKVSCVWIFLYFIFDGLVWICAGFLTAFKDTVFILIANATNAWLFALLPTYWFIVVKQNTPDKAWAVIVVYGLINMVCFMLRLRYKVKQQAQLI